MKSKPSSSSLAATLRVTFVIYLLVSLVAVPCADWLAGLMTGIAGAGDLRDGAILMETVRQGSVAYLLIPLAFATVIVLPLSLPLRMTWLSALAAPEEDLRAHFSRGFRRALPAAAAYFLIMATGLLLLTALVVAAWLVHTSFDGDPNGRSAAVWTAVACVPLLVVGLLCLAATDLSHAACLHASPVEAVRRGLRGSLRSLPRYVLYVTMTIGLFVAGSAVEASPWLLLVSLQPLVFARFFTRALWLQHALSRVTSGRLKAM